MRKFWAIKEVRVAILVIGALFLVYTGLSYLRGRDVLSQPMQVEANYARINGLNTGDPVLLNGYQVGKVNETLMDPTSYRIRVRFDIERRIKLPKNSIAVIAAINLFGDKGIVLVPGSGKALLSDGDQLADSLEVALTDRIQTELSPVVENLNTTIASMNRVFVSLDAVLRDTAKYQRLVSDLGTTARNFAETSEGLNRMAVQLDSASASFRRTLANLEAQNARIDRLMAGAATVSDSLAAASSDLKAGISTLRASLSEVEILLAQINQGQGTLGKLAQDDSLYTNLNQTAESLNRLLIDFREHPKRYIHFSVFGRKDKSADSAKGDKSP